MIQRFEGHCFPKAIKSKALRSVIVGLVVIGLCYAVSLLGLSTIISKIYGYDGYYALIVVVLPAFIWGIPKIKKLSARRRQSCLSDLTKAQLSGVPMKKY